ncbi:MAG: hypothetical protein AB7O97_11925 [Planctomycetota bacterium]
MRIRVTVAFAAVLGGLSAQQDPPAGGAQPAQPTAAEAAAAEMRAKGMVEVSGVWVEKEHAEDARRGVFHHGGKLVTRDEYEELQAGAVRHPITGRLIPAADLERARERSFPIGSEDRWVDEREADRHHADPSRPWVVNTGDYVLISTLPIAKLEAIRGDADRALGMLRPILGFADPLPTSRPTVLVAATTDQFVEYGNRLGDETSAFGAFLAQAGRTVRVPGQGVVVPAVCHWDENWGPYYLPHAIGIAYIAGICAAADTEVEAWFRHAMAAYASRFPNPETGAWFAQSLARTGGLQPLDGWFDGFKIDGTKSPEDLGAQMTQAGLLIQYCVHGGDLEATQALGAVTEAFPTAKAGAIAKSVSGLRKHLQSKATEIGDYLQKLAR